MKLTRATGFVSDTFTSRVENPTRTRQWRRDRHQCSRHGRGEATVAQPELRGEQLAGVPRQGSGAADAVRALLKGPSHAEIRSGFRTYVPRGTALHSVSIANGVATVDLGARFKSGSSGSLLARLSQLVRTVSAVTSCSYGRPTCRCPHPHREKQLPFDKRVQQAQQRLIELRYLPPGSADGRFGPVTQEGVFAFQKWERLSRTGVIDGATRSRLNTAQRPSPVTRGGTDKRAEVLVDRQVALLIVANKVVHAISVSTGKPSTPTPPGSYRVYAKIARWWSVPFREWLPWAVPFVGGIAFHEYPIIPVYPASHGCVRQPEAVARMTYDFAEIGMPVAVLAKS